MVKKIRIEKWELYYGLISMVLFGFWIGYILGGSSSWAAKPYVRDEIIIPNGAVILGFMVIMYLLVKIILYYHRKLELNKKADQLKNLK